MEEKRRRKDLETDGRKNLTGRYALAQCFFWAVRSALTAFAALYLQEKGVGASFTGVFLAVVSVMPALIMPYVAGRADRSEKHGLRFFFYVSAGLLAAALLVLIPLQKAIAGGRGGLLFGGLSGADDSVVPALRLSGAGFLLFYFCALVLASVPEPFLNSMSGYYERHHFRVNFGMGRGIGSLSFALSSFVIGHTVSLWSVDLIPGFALACILLCGASVALLPPVLPAGTETTPADRAEKSGRDENRGTDQNMNRSTDLFSFLRRYPRYTVLMAGFFFTAIFHTMTETYIFNMMEHLGGDSGSAGTALLIANVAEFAVIFNYERFRKKMSGSRWLVLTACLFFLKAVLFHFAPNLPFMYGAQALQAVTFGFYAPSVVHFAEEEVLPADAVRGQTVFMSAFMLGGCFGNLSGGLLLGSFPVPVMTGAAMGSAALGAAIALLTLRMRGSRIHTREEGKQKRSIT